MTKFEFCLPRLSKAVPAGPDWIHGIKYDGYRLRVERDGDGVRLITKGGYDSERLAFRRGDADQWRDPIHHEF
jgi:ATP-dependent DNA ligase